MDELREPIARMITGDHFPYNFPLADKILNLIRNHETKLELVTVVSYENHPDAEITRPMTVAEVLEWAQDVATWETTPLEGGNPFPDFKGGRVRVRKTP